MKTSVKSGDARNPLPIFFSRELREECENALEAFEAYERKINLVSADIKSLENFLKAKNIPLSFEYECESSSLGYSSPRIAWDTDTSLGYRLLFRYSSDSFNFDENPDIDKPLIEMPLKTRLGIYKELPNFVKFFSEFVGNITGDENNFSADEIPF